MVNRAHNGVASTQEQQSIQQSLQLQVFVFSIFSQLFSLVNWNKLFI